MLNEEQAFNPYSEHRFMILAGNCGCGSQFSKEEQCFLSHFSEDQQATLLFGVDILNRHIALNFPDVDPFEAKKQWVDTLFKTRSFDTLKYLDTLETRLFCDMAKQCELGKTIYYTNDEWIQIIDQRRKNDPCQQEDTVAIPLNVIPNQTEFMHKRDSLPQLHEQRRLTLNLNGLFLASLNDCSADSALYTDYCERRFLHHHYGYPFEFCINVFPDEHKNFIFDALLLMDLYYPIAPYITGEYSDYTKEEWR